MVYWTEEQVRFLRENYQVLGDTEIAEIFSSRYVKEKGWTLKHIEKKRRYLKLKRSRSEIAAIRTRNSQRGCFLKDVDNQVGTPSASVEGTMRMWLNSSKKLIVAIKVKGKYVHYNPWLYKKHHGKIPKGYVIVAKEGASMIPTIDQLECIPRPELTRRIVDKRDGLPKELRKLRILTRKLKNKLK